MFYDRVMSKLRTRFLIGSSASISFTYVGLSIRSYRDGITVDQGQYVSSLQPILVNRARALQKHSMLSDSEKTDYRALCGQLHWVATNTRPDVAFESCELSALYKMATVTDLLCLNKLVYRVKKDQLHLYFPKFFKDWLL